MRFDIVLASLLTVMPHTSVLRSVSSTLVTKNASKGYNAYREFHEVGELCVQCALTTF
jgi:hypothetical protein